jgi:uncharacterized phage protein gp47/JayE
MGATPICVIDATGIHKPLFADSLTYFQNAYKGIYGNDIYIDQTAPDGQLLALLATALDDSNSMSVATYESFSPSTAQGTGLSSVVKINGIPRLVPGYSTAPLLVVGSVGTHIINGLVKDVPGNQWALPASVVIPAAGQISVTVTCTTIGAITAPVGTINSIFTPIPNWQTAVSTADATPGAPVETDSALRQRQTISTQLPSQSILQGIEGAIAAVPNVTRLRAYENDTIVTDALGIPPNSIALVVEGGDQTAVATVIQNKKGSGANTYGTTTVSVPDIYGIPRAINFSLSTNVNITFAANIKTKPGYTATDGTNAIASLVQWVNSLSIGDGFALNDAGVALKQFSLSVPYTIVSMEVARGANPLTAADIAVVYNEACITNPGWIQLNTVI